MSKNDIESLVLQRGEVYGPPEEDFGRLVKMAEQIQKCPDPLIKHVLYMVLLKVSRLVETPDHEDSLYDIQGYAQTALDMIARRRPKDKAVDLQGQLQAEMNKRQESWTQGTLR